ncbi:PREDICTED: TBC1 domain family member 17 [Gekko japonicus]|uniref:TBC1 domain family member 17 n=1 Tax=Gekko japonicus TaxID=146911 RepID=A0ABM1KJW9_GEKJA|nr:PREDICTED: TBC1 domain family member 17 [Gekko japonicus]
MELGACRVAFEKDGVYLHTSAKRHPDQDSIIPGVIRIIEKGSDTLLQWMPVEETSDAAQITFTKKDTVGCQADEEIFDPGYEPDWAVISTVGTPSRVQEETNAASGPKSPVPRGQWAFTLHLSELKSIRKSKPGLGWSYLIFITKDGVSIQALHFHRGGTKALLKALCKYVILATSPKDSRLYLVYTHDSYALTHSFDELQLFDDSSSNLVSRFLQDPYAATFGGFSKVTNFFRGALHHEDGTPQHPQSDPGAGNVEDETGFELITCQARLAERPSVQREAPVTEQEWEQHLDPCGRVVDPSGLRRRIFAGVSLTGVRGSRRGPLQARKQQAKEKRADEYFRMKLQWKSVSEEQERRNSLLRGYRSLIERDVSRTDRNNKFYEGSENPGLVLLNDVLMTYCMYNFDLGYVQGMSDLLSPILYITQNEVDAFWCFCGFMALVHRNFEESQESMKRQLAQLTLLLRVLDPPLCDFLDSKESGTLCFCFRWILIWFKREFAFSEILQLWERHKGEPLFRPNAANRVSGGSQGGGGGQEARSGNLASALRSGRRWYERPAGDPPIPRLELHDLPRNVQELLGLSEGKSPSPSTDTASSPQPLSPSQAQEMELTDSVSPSQPDSSIEILPTEEGTTSQSLSP